MAGDTYANEKATEEWVKVLTGEGFCANPGLGLTEEQASYCQSVTEQFIPFAFKAISDDIRQASQRICNVWFDGICEYPWIVNVISNIYLKIACTFDRSEWACILHWIKVLIKEYCVIILNQNNLNI